MSIGMTAIRGTVVQGQLVPSGDLSLLNGVEVIVIGRAHFNQIAGSDSTRFQLELARKALALTISKITDELTEDELATINAGLEQGGTHE